MFQQNGRRTRGSASADERKRVGWFISNTQSHSPPLAFQLHVAAPPAKDERRGLRGGVEGANGGEQADEDPRREQPPPSQPPLSPLAFASSSIEGWRVAEPATATVRELTTFFRFFERREDAREESVAGEQEGKNGKRKAKAGRARASSRGLAEGTAARHR